MTKIMGCSKLPSKAGNFERPRLTLNAPLYRDVVFENKSQLMNQVTTQNQIKSIQMHRRVYLLTIFNHKHSQTHRIPHCN